MDKKTRLFTGILLSSYGLYLLLNGFRSVVMRKNVLIFPMHYFIWLNRLFHGDEAAEKIKNEKLQPKHWFFNGVSNIVIGGITLAMGILLLIPE